MRYWNYFVFPNNFCEKNFLDIVKEKNILTKDDLWTISGQLDLNESIELCLIISDF